jgi:hypothetical protein
VLHSNATERMKGLLLHTTALMLVAASTAFCQGARLGASCDLSLLGATETKSFLAFDQELRGALSKQDAVSMALLVQFPLRINADAGSYSLNDPAALQSHFQEVFSAAVRTAVLNQRTAIVFCNYQGAMCGKGVVWINLTSHGYAVRVVNLPTGRSLKTACRRTSIGVRLPDGDTSNRDRCRRSELATLQGVEQAALCHRETRPGDSERKQGS